MKSPLQLQLRRAFVFVKSGVRTSGVYGFRQKAARECTGRNEGLKRYESPRELCYAERPVLRAPIGICLLVKHRALPNSLFPVVFALDANKGHKEDKCRHDYRVCVGPNSPKERHKWICVFITVFHPVGSASFFTRFHQARSNDSPFALFRERKRKRYAYRPGLGRDKHQ